MDDIVGKIRIQINNPCQPWGADSPSSVTYYNCDDVPVKEEIIRSNCNNQKIIAWFKHKPLPNEYNLGESFGTDGISQVVCRIVGHCSTTEYRDNVSGTPFEPTRYIRENDFSGKTVYCGNASNYTMTLSAYWEVVFTICDDFKYSKGGINPIIDIRHNKNSGVVYAGIVSNDGQVIEPFVEYGTRKLDDDGCISANCITNTDDINFLYIPCGHFSKDSSVQTGRELGYSSYILDGAFSGLTSLRGIWIDSGGYDNKHFKYSSSTNPFGGCENSLEIVYCPSDWEDYFLRKNSSNELIFQRLIMINGIPIVNGEKATNVSTRPYCE